MFDFEDTRGGVEIRGLKWRFLLLLCFLADKMELWDSVVHCEFVFRGGTARAESRAERTPHAIPPPPKGCNRYIWMVCDEKLSI